jgi:predicted HTH transcriptional regulator
MCVQRQTFSQVRRAFTRTRAPRAQEPREFSRLSKTANELTEALRLLPDGQVASSQELADRLNIHPRLVQAVLRRLVRAGYLKQLGKERSGPLHVTPTEKLRRSASSDTED